MMEGQTIRSASAYSRHTIYHVINICNGKDEYHDFACSGNGNYSFAVAHDATFYVINNSNLEVNKVNLKHNACSKIIPLADNQVVLISYDRELFLYDFNYSIDEGSRIFYFEVTFVDPDKYP